MLIGVLSDIHGNDAALSAALAEAKTLGVSELFLLGDYVGYYYRPKEVLALLEPWPREMIRGNHEEMTARALDDAAWAVRLKTKYGGGHDAAIASLGADGVRALAALPGGKTVARDGLTIELCHGAPWDLDAYVYPDADAATLARCAESKADFVLMGHTHRPFQKRESETTLVNVGSVGQPRDAGGAAAWALLDTSARSIVLRRTPYDVGPLAEEAARRDPALPYLKDVLFRRPS